jgi:hypothetical protein
MLQGTMWFGMPEDADGCLLCNIGTNLLHHMALHPVRPYLNNQYYANFISFCLFRIFMATNIINSSDQLFTVLPLP